MDWKNRDLYQAWNHASESLSKDTLPSCWNLKDPIGNKETQLDRLNLEMKTPVSSKQWHQFLIEGILLLAFLYLMMS